MNATDGSERDGSEIAADASTEVLAPTEPEEWPVTEFYRVTPETNEPADASTLVVSSSAATESPTRRRLPRASAALAVAIILATLGIALGAWLLERDTGQANAGASSPPASETNPVAPPPTSPPGTSSGREVANVVGLRASNARVLLEQAGFDIRVARRSSDRPPGEVLEQSPVAGRTLQPGGRVTLTIARAAEPVVVRIDVPDVVSLPVAEATASLRRAGLRAQVELVPSSARAGTVVEQKPAAGSEVEEGTLVALSIARSQSPAVIRVEVPDVVGSTVAEARQTLRALGLRVSVTTVLAQEPAGTVVGQTPSANRAVREGSSVRLRVSAGPRSATVPEVMGLDEMTARAELEAAGFVVRVSEEWTDDPANDGVVLAQTPAGGSSREEGAVVTLVIGRFG